MLWSAKRMPYSAAIAVSCAPCTQPIAYLCFSQQKMALKWHWPTPVGAGWPQVYYRQRWLN